MIVYDPFNFGEDKRFTEVDEVAETGCNCTSLRSRVSSVPLAEKASGRGT